MEVYLGMHIQLHQPNECLYHCFYYCSTVHPDSSCGYEWKESFREMLIQVVAFIDANPVVPDCPNRKSHSFFKAYAKEAFSEFGITVDSKDDNVFDCMDFLYFITYLRFLAFAILGGIFVLVVPLEGFVLLIEYFCCFVKRIKGKICGDYPTSHFS
jgi:hypothetical protein